MKELSIEEKAKAYDRVREKIALRFGTDVAEGIFSEFEESEDDRIRKALIEMVHDTTGDELWVDYNVHKEEALAWLEKQGETYTKKDVDNAYLEGMAFAKDELEKQCKQKPQRMISAEAKEAMYNKPTWSEEDEDKLTSCIEAITACYQWDSMIEWLKSLKERVHPKQEWSEKDEEELEIAIDTLKESGRYDSAKWVQSLKQRIGG